MVLHTVSQKKPIEIITKKPKYRVNFYDSLITESLKFVNRERAYFTYKMVNDSAKIQWFIERASNLKILSKEEKKRLKQEIVFPDFDTTLSAKNKALIKKLRGNKSKDNNYEVHNLFSYPYLVSKDRILIFQSNHYIVHVSEKGLKRIDSIKNVPKETKNYFKKSIIKGGGEAIVIFQRENGKWKITQEEVLIKY